MIQNRAFNDFSKMVRGVVLLLENDVIGKRDDYNQLTDDLIRDAPRLGSIVKTAANILEDIGEKYDVPKDPLRILSSLGEKGDRKVNLINLQRSIKNLEKSVDVIKDQQKLMMEHAGFGISVA